MNTQKLKQYCYLARLHRPSGLFLLWPTLWALWLAGRGHPSLHIVIIFIIGAIIMRSAGDIINDLADRHVDGHVMRTHLRPLVTGMITTKEAFIFLFILLLISFLLVLCLNDLTILLAFAGVLFAVVYPFMKRFTHWPQAGLGVAFSWGVPMAFAAVNNEIFLKDWLVFFAAMLWPIIYDTFYAMVDRPDDVKIGIKSTAILFGERCGLVVGFLQGLFLLLLVWMGYLYQLHASYYLSLCIVGMLFIYQQRLIRSNQSDLYFKAFLNNHWVGCVIFIGIVGSYLFLI